MGGLEIQPSFQNKAATIKTLMTSPLRRLVLGNGEGCHRNVPNGARTSKQSHSAPKIMQFNRTEGKDQ
jgi:hypothetical protein